MLLASTRMLGVGDKNNIHVKGWWMTSSHATLCIYHSLYEIIFIIRDIQGHGMMLQCCRVTQEHWYQSQAEECVP